MHSENERMGSGRAPAHRPPNRSWILRHRFRTLCVSRSTPLVGSLAEPETSCATASHPTLTSSASSSTRQRLMHRSVQRHQQCLPIGTSQVRRMEPARNPLRQTLIDLPISGCAHKVIERSHLRGPTGTDQDRVIFACESELQIRTFKITASRSFNRSPGETISLTASNIIFMVTPRPVEDRSYFCDGKCPVNWQRSS